MSGRYGIARRYSRMRKQNHSEGRGDIMTARYLLTENLTFPTTRRVTDVVMAAGLAFWKPCIALRYRSAFRNPMTELQRCTPSQPVQHLLSLLICQASAGEFLFIVLCAYDLLSDCCLLQSLRYIYQNQALFSIETWMTSCRVLDLALQDCEENRPVNICLPRAS